MSLAPASGAVPARRPGELALASIVASDFLGSVGGALVHLTMVWWVLEKGLPTLLVSLMVLCIFLPMNLGVLLTGVAVERFGSRRLLLASKLMAAGGAAACFLLLAAGMMTLPILAALAVVTYGAMAPSVAADLARVPALSRLAGRRLVVFHSADGIAVVVGQVFGLIGAGLSWDAAGPSLAVGLGVLCLLGSVGFTWAGFPRDRRSRTGRPAQKGRVAAMSREVLARLDGVTLTPGMVCVAAALIATAQSCIEVAFPVAVAAAGQSAASLAFAFVLSISVSVVATLIAQRVQGRVRLSTALLVIAVPLFAILAVVQHWAGLAAFYVAVGATAAAATGAGTLTVTALQQGLPPSLQAQGIGLWKFLVLSVGSVTIFVTGLVAAWSLTFIAGIAAVALAGAVGVRRNGTREAGDRAGDGHV